MGENFVKSMGEKRWVKNHICEKKTWVNKMVEKSIGDKRKHG